MPRKIEKIYSGDRVVKVRILPKVKNEIGKVGEKGVEVEEKVVEIGKGVKEATMKTVERGEETLAEVKGKLGMSLDEAVTVFTKIPTITKEKAERLYNEGFTSLKGLASAAPEKLLTIRNITLENVKNIKKELKDFYEEEVKFRVEKIEEKPVEKSMKWVEDVTKRMVSVGKDSLKKAKTGAFLAKDRVSETYRKLATPEKPKQVEKKVEIKSTKKKVKMAQKKKKEIKPKKKTVKPVKKKAKRKTKKSGKKKIKKIR